MNEGPPRAAPCAGRGGGTSATESRPPRWLLHHKRRAAHTRKTGKGDVLARLAHPGLRRKRGLISAAGAWHGLGRKKIGKRAVGLVATPQTRNRNSHPSSLLSAGTRQKAPPNLRQSLLRGKVSRRQPAATPMKTAHSLPIQRHTLGAEGSSRATPGKLAASHLLSSCCCCPP